MSGIITRPVEILDRCTCIAALVVWVRNDGTESERFCGLFGKVGVWGPEWHVLLVHLAEGRAEWDPFQWNDRTMHNAHLELVDRAPPPDTAESPMLLDIEHLLGERPDIRGSDFDRGGDDAER